MVHATHLENTMADILRTTFVLAVQDLTASTRFYVEKLGFVEDFTVEGWAFLSRGVCQLRLGHCPLAVPMSQVPDHSWFAYLHVNDARALYHEYCNSGVEIWHSLDEKPWGMREFAIVTPDGHRIVFGEELTK
jgi:catechol 2,3-dioxygenase-like lactoylglutathione lyase family enzyme